MACSIFIERRFADLMACNLTGGGAAAIIVDMPIGLAETGRRACEALARQRLGAGRASSVFAAPRRAMLAFTDYRAANEWGKAQGFSAGGGLSKQAWNILPKIHEIDETLTPVDQKRIGEGHPELTFLRLNEGRACLNSKRTAKGRAERLAILERNGFFEARRLFAEARSAAGAGVASDDVYDACALAMTAAARLEGSALRFSDDARDARGLVMEIWG